MLSNFFAGFFFPLLYNVAIEYENLKSEVGVGTVLNWVVIFKYWYIGMFE